MEGNVIAPPARLPPDGRDGEARGAVGGHDRAAVVEQRRRAAGTYLWLDRPCQLWILVVRGLMGCSLIKPALA